MKTVAAILISMLTAGLAPGLAVAQTSQRHDHGHAAATDLKPDLNKGKKWKTDAPLRQGMEKVRAVVDLNLPQAHEGKMTDEAYLKAASEIDKQVQFIFASCKLEPDADANLHKILVPIIKGSDAMKGKVKGLSRQRGFIQIVDALDQYGKYFEHPGWKSLTH